LPISFQLSEEQQLFQETARKLAADRLWPRIRDTEARRGIAPELAREIAELGLTTLGIPEAAGGQGLGLFAQGLVDEQLAWGDAGAALAAPGPGALLPFLLELGSPDQQREVLSRFTEAGGELRHGAVAWSESTPAAQEGFATRARTEGDGWVIDGVKSFVLGAGLADRYVVIAQVDPDAGWRGLGAFVVPGDAPGLSPRPRRQLLGLDAAHVADLELRSVRVPYSAQLAPIQADLTEPLTRAFLRLSLRNAARQVGVATRAWELARTYCTERHAFGKPIGHFQAIAFTVSDRLMDVDGARWMLWRAAADWDRQGEPNPAHVAAACAQASEAAIRCGDDGVQLFGGAGFIRDYPIEKLFRDARQLALMGPSAATLDQLAIGAELGLPLDPAVTLPTPDIQPVVI
jgi:alkylation response protein AidB-like acyl-CoA dehydrogenase